MHAKAISVKPDFVVLSDRQRPEFVSRVTLERVKAMANDLANDEVAARERLISLGPAAIPHLLNTLSVAEPLRDPEPTSRIDAATLQLAWVIDELGATDKLPAKLRREYFERRMADGSTHVGSCPIDEDAVCRALSHCSFAEFCSICLAAPGRSDPAGSWGWMHMNSIVFSRRFDNQPRFVSGDPANFPFWNRVTPAANPQQEIADAVPVLIADLNHWPICLGSTTKVGRPLPPSDLNSMSTSRSSLTTSTGPGAKGLPKCAGVPVTF